MVIVLCIVIVYSTTFLSAIGALCFRIRIYGYARVLEIERKLQLKTFDCREYTPFLSPQPSSTKPQHQHEHEHSLSRESAKKTISRSTTNLCGANVPYMYMLAIIPR